MVARSKNFEPGLMLALVACLVCCAGGCQPAPAAVSGKVTLDGQPLDEAVIVFVPLEAGRRKTGAEIHDGAYVTSAVDGLLPGNYRVEIADNPPLSAAHGSGARPRTPVLPPGRRVLPSRYAHDSPLTIQWSGKDEARFDFRLTVRP
jgi:hypothetical protein